MKKNLLLTVFVLIGLNAFAQITLPGGVPIITGNNTANTNDTKIYEAYPPFGETIFAATWSLSGGGVIQSQSKNQATILWTSAGTHTINYNVTSSTSGKMKATFVVTVTSSAPSNPANPTIVSQDCTTATLQKVGSIPSGQMWYWHTSSGSTDTSSPATANYVATSASSGNITYWLRALDTASNTWSSGAGSVTVNFGTVGGMTYYEDQDGDGLGDPGSTTLVSCTQPIGYVTNNNDNCPLIFGPVTNGGCPSTNPFSDENYVHTLVPQIPTSDVSSLLADQKLENITYFDGLGRAKQSIAIKQSPNGNDIVTHIEYDAIGRQEKDYLPFVSVNNDGFIKVDAELKTRQYYQTNYADDFTAMALADINPYSQKVFEASPLSRVFEQTAPGKDWKKANNNVAGKGYSEGNSIKFEYDTNTGTEVKLFNATTTYNTTEKLYMPTLSVSATNGGNYNVAELSKTITKDENWKVGDGLNHTTEEFKDKQGRVVLKRTYATISGTPTAHDTYYVYDDYGNLTYVLPPKVDVSDGVSATELSELCYQYKYDGRNRLVEKKIPGKGLEYIIYDKLDRPVLTQDANLEANDHWLFTKYDALGRVAYTGLMIVQQESRASLQALVNTQTVLNENRKSTITYLQGWPIYYSNLALDFSSIAANITEVYTINYYDTYIPLGSGFTAPSTVINQAVTTNTKSLPTVSKVRVLDNTSWITTATYYNEKAQPIYVYSENEYLGTTDIVKSELDFTGKVLQTESLHTNTNASGLGTQKVQEFFEYDATGRLVKQKHQINDGDIELMALNTYDDLGQLISKGVGNDASSSNRLQTVDYDYNVRGWLKQINDPSTLGTDLFGFKINYNTVDHNATKLYNGNIAETEWKTANTDSNLKWYKYNYDALNRIEFALSNDGKFDVGSVTNPITYDKNGNIESLYRKGHVVVNPSLGNSSDYNVMDDLSYTYDGNKLLKVSDAIVTPALMKGEFKDDHNTAGIDPTNDYTYDANGNMLTDANKGISSNISYNHLNLPTLVTLSSGNISYIYDATGVKLKKTVSTGATTKYAGNYIYEDSGSGDVLKFFNHPEGYVEPDGSGGFDYVYQYKDHLGNIRLSYKNTGTTSSPTLQIQEENNYYPFGLKHKGYNNNIVSEHPYKYQGQELNESLDYDMYEFQLRHYDAAIGRFVTTDPYEQFMSPYLAMGNNPVVSFDPDGGYCTDANGNKIACPDDEIYDDYRDDEKNGISIPDEAVIINVNSSSSSSNSVSVVDLGSSTTYMYYSPQVGDKIAPAMNERPDGFHRDWDEMMLNIFGYSSFQQGQKIHHVDANGRVVAAAPEYNDAGAIGIIGGPGTGSIKLISFRGLVQNQKLMSLTHHQLVNAFKGTGLKLSGHAIKRLKDPRTKALGVETLNDFKRIINKGVKFNAGKGDIGYSLGKLEVIITKNNVIRTIRPAKNIR